MENSNFPGCGLHNVHFGHSFHSELPSAVTVIIESLRVFKCILFDNILSDWNGRAMIRMKSEAYLFAPQYLSSVRNTILRHAGIPFYMAEKQKHEQGCGFLPESARDMLAEQIN